MTANVPTGEVKTMRERIVADYARSARLPGFRPGKVPFSVVAKHFAREVQEQLLLDMEGELKKGIFDQNPNLRILRFRDMEHDEQEDGSCKLAMSAMVLPSFELPEYVGIEVTEESEEVSDDEVEDVMKQFAETFATHEPVERAAKEEDQVTIDFKTSVEGKPTAEYCGKPVGFMEGREDYCISLDDHFIPELVAGLIGAMPGEQRDITAKLSEHFPINDLRGKEMLISCTVKQVLEKHVPEVSADLFSGIFPDKNMDEIRVGVRNSLKTGKQRKNETSKSDQITNYLASSLSFALPEELVETESSSILQNNILRAIQDGKYNAEEDMGRMRNDAHDEATRALRVCFALQEIADKEKIEVNDYELSQELARRADQDREKNLRNYIRKQIKEGRIESIRLKLLFSKVMEQLVRRAKVVNKETPSSEE